MHSNIENRKINTKWIGGFSLIEIMVALSVFSVIMVISMGSILSVLDGNKKSQSLRAVMDNMNSTLETMTRTIRFGSNYHSWGCVAPVDISIPHDCNTGDSTFTVLEAGTTEVTYKLNAGRITRTIGLGGDEFITSPDVVVTKLTFYVFGSQPYCSTISPSCSTQDIFQPRVIIVVEGNAGSTANTQTKFTLQTMVSQRLFDFQ